MHFVVVISIISIDPWSVREMFPCPMMLSLIKHRRICCCFFLIEESPYSLFNYTNDPLDCLGLVFFLTVSKGYTFKYLINKSLFQAFLI